MIDNETILTICSVLMVLLIIAPFTVLRLRKSPGLSLATRTGNIIVVRQHPDAIEVVRTSPVVHADVDTMTVLYQAPEPQLLTTVELDQVQNEIRAMFRKPRRASSSIRRYGCIDTRGTEHPVPEIISEPTFAYMRGEGSVVQIMKPLILGKRVGGDERDMVLVQPGHGIVARDTTGGKTNQVINIGVQALAAGAKVWFISPKYVRIDSDGLDMKPFVDRCDRIAVKIKDDFGKSALLMLEQAMEFVVDRIDASADRAVGELTPTYIIVEELKALQGLWEKLEADAKLHEKRPHDKRYKYARGGQDAQNRGTQAINILLALGAQLRVFVIVTGQDAQVTSLGLSQGSQKNFQWNIVHPDLDTTSLYNTLGGKAADIEQYRKQCQSGHDWIVQFKRDGLREIQVFHSERVTNAWIAAMIGHLPCVDHELSSPVKEVAPPPIGGPKPIVVQLASAIDTGPVTMPQTVPAREPDVHQMVQVAYAMGKLAAQGQKVSQRKVADMVLGSQSGRIVVEMARPIAAVERMLAIGTDGTVPDRATLRLQGTPETPGTALEQPGTEDS